VSSPGSAVTGPAWGSATTATPESVASGLALADGPGDVGAAETVGDVVAIAGDGEAGVRVAVPDAVPVFFLAGCFVGLLLADGLMTGAAGAGDAGATPGGSAAPPFCHDSATVPPAGTDREPAAVVEYFQPDEPSDQYSPQ
jgi:hypothetical protein